MKWSLPLSVQIGKKEFAIRNKCDYRVILDVIEVLNDDDLEASEQIECALFIFYGNDELNTEKKVLKAIGKANLQTAINEMMNIIKVDEDDGEMSDKPKMMDWAKDFKHIAAPISRTLGYSVRDARNYTHWYDFIGAYQEIGECFWASVVSIRNKRYKGKKLEKWEQEFYSEHKDVINIQKNLTADEQEWLVSDL